MSEVKACVYLIMAMKKKSEWHEKQMRKMREREGKKGKV